MVRPVKRPHGAALAAKIKTNKQSPQTGLGFRGFRNGHFPINNISVKLEYDSSQKVPSNKTIWNPKSFILPKNVKAKRHLVDHLVHNFPGTG